MNKIFVYGTLKRGGSNHHFLVGQQFITEAHSESGFTLHLLNGYPGMVRARDDQRGVTGELWSVDDDCLAQLDELEGVDEQLYARIEIKLAAPLVAERVQTYLYLRDVSVAPHLGETFPV